MKAENEPERPLEEAQRRVTHIDYVVLFSIVLPFGCVSAGAKGGIGGHALGLLIGTSLACAGFFAIRAIRKCWHDGNLTYSAGWLITMVTGFGGPALVRRLVSHHWF